MRRFSLSWWTTLAKLGLSKKGGKSYRASKCARFTRPLRLEGLEDRRMMATLVVNTTADTSLYDSDDLLSFREAIAVVNNGNLNGLSQKEQEQVKGALGDDVIQFELTLGDRTISLTAGLTLTRDVEIIGPGADRLVVDGAGASGNTTFVISGITAAISDITISGMDGPALGALALSDSDVTLDGVSVSDNNTFGVAVYAGSTLTMSNSTVANNAGDAIRSSSISAAGDQTYINVTISGNAGSGYTYGNGSNDTTFVNSTITDNGSAGIYSGILVPMLLKNTIVAENEGSYDFMFSVDPASSHNLIGSVTAIGGISEPQDGVHGKVGGAYNAALSPLD